MNQVTVTSKVTVTFAIDKEVKLRVKNARGWKKRNNLNRLAKLL
jgi:hypothetical protein